MSIEEVEKKLAEVVKEIKELDEKRKTLVFQGLKYQGAIEYLKEKGNDNG